MLSLGALAGPTNVVLHLKNGDRVTGTWIATESNRIVIATSWLPTLAIPLTEITNREFGLPATTASAPKTNAVAVTPPPKTAPAPVAAKSTKRWRADLRMGADFQNGAKDRSLYFSSFKLTYEQPYKANPKKFFRNIIDYRVDYGETEGNKSVNRMSGSMKTDFDLSESWYLYNLGVVGYDEFRKIDLGYEIGPGLGYHLLHLPRFVLDVELGLNYQYQERTTSQIVESLYARAAESLTWKIADRVTWTEKFEFYPNLDSPEDHRMRFESTLSFGLIQNLSLNFSVLDIFDTQPAPNVDQNELLVRSSLGFSF